MKENWFINDTTNTKLLAPKGHLTSHIPEQRNFLACALFMVPFSCSCRTAVRKIFLISSETALQALAFLAFATLLDSICGREGKSHGQWSASIQRK